MTPKGPIHGGVKFPLKGLNTATGYEAQPEGTSPSLLNVRAFDVAQERARGGSRSGLAKSTPDLLGGGSKVNLLSKVTSISGHFDGKVEWWDEFHRIAQVLGPAWSQAPWLDNSPATAEGFSSVIYSPNDCGAVLEADLDIDTSQAYSVVISTIPYSNEYYGTYKLHLQMDDTSPDATTEGVTVELRLISGTQDTWTITINDLAADGSATSEQLGSGAMGDPASYGELEVSVDGDTYTVYWKGTEVGSTTLTSHSGDTMGFTLSPQTMDQFYIQMMGMFLVYADSLNDQTRPRTTMLVAGSNGNIYSEQRIGRLSECPTTNVNITTKSTLDAAEHLQKLYIGDFSADRIEGDGSVDSDGVTLTDTAVSDWTTHGIDVDNDIVILSAVTGSVTAGNYEIASVASGSVTLASSCGGSGTADYRISRAPKVYDPKEDTLSIWKATEGIIPLGCSICERYRGRLILARNNKFPHLGHMSRVDDPTDWDVGAEDSTAAVSWQGTEFGTIGEPITAVAAWGDDYLIVGCSSDIWIMLGDPSYGGKFYNVSHQEGVLTNNAWCWGPSGEFYFLGRQGFYMIQPGGANTPEPLSQGTIPNELKHINTRQYDVNLAWSVKESGVHITMEERL